MERRTELCAMHLLQPRAVLELKLWIDTVKLGGCGIRQELSHHARKRLR